MCVLGPARDSGGRGMGSRGGEKFVRACALWARVGKMERRGEGRKGGRKGSVIDPGRDDGGLGWLAR